MIFGSFARNLSVFGAGFALLATATPVLPQDGNDEARLRRLEAEVRALQRKVFPGGDGRFFEPEMTAQPSVNSTTSGTSTTAVTDILARLDALEAQLQRQTALNEENANALRHRDECANALQDAFCQSIAIDTFQYCATFVFLYCDHLHESYAFLQK